MLSQIKPQAPLLVDLGVMWHWQTTQFNTGCVSDEKKPLCYDPLSISLCQRPLFGSACVVSGLVHHGQQQRPIEIGVVLPVARHLVAAPLRSFPQVDVVGKAFEEGDMPV